VHATLDRLERTDFPSLRRRKVETLQVNLGYKCNQSCVHCHVNAGPTRTEQMASETVEAVLAYLEAAKIPALDLTGGAPELNPHFRELVVRARRLCVHVMDRCNLTVTQQPGQEDLAQFLAAHEVEIVASLPCYLEENVDRQRGKGVFEASIRALQDLNALGYGRGRGLKLNLVYNPQGAVLPPPQDALEADYKRHLAERYGIAFDRLYVLTNMPIQRFGSMLVSKGQLESYLTLLKNAYQPENLENVMCRSLLSIDWRGYVYDCDFNQMLGLPLVSANRSGAMHVRDLIHAALEGNPIVVKDHCYGCTAGQGSSCGGALA
jgi:radical SAM/Cys-rich protein